VLKNPRYAGAFVYGRLRTRRTPEGREGVYELPRAEWHTLLPSAHPGYVSWEEYEDNLSRLRENAQAQGEDRRQSPPREGPALLQGLVICGRCGQRMTVRYYSRSGRTVPDYMCQKDGIANAQPICQHVLGWELDRAVGELLVETVTPLALEVALAVQDELNSRAEEVDRLRHQQVERVRYDAELAQRRYLRVDPDNRLVADSLEADWNQKLRALAASQVEYERQREADRLLLDDEQRARVLALATDFPRLWQDPLTPDRERKRMVRLLLEDITLLRHDHITAHIRFKGGATRTLTLPLPLPAPQLRQTRPEVVQEIDRLLDQHTDGEVAAILNQRGFQPGVASAFDSRIVAKLRRNYGLPDRFARLRRAGLLTLSEVTSLLDLHHQTAKAWEREGRLRAHVFNDKGERLFEHPGDRPPGKYHWQRLQRRAPSFPSKRAEGVQSDA
jgi:recombinase-like zinc beta ribbon protein